MTKRIEILKAYRTLTKEYREMCYANGEMENALEAESRLMRCNALLIRLGA